jgi:hypothetical protein
MNLKQNILALVAKANNKSQKQPKNFASREKDFFICHWKLWSQPFFCKNFTMGA